MPQDPWAALMQGQPRDPWRAVDRAGYGKNITLENLARLGEYGYGQGTRFMGRAEQSLDPVLGFYRMLLGDREAAMEAMGPEISTIVSQYDAARKAAAEFAPRGGGKTQVLAESPFREAGDIARLIQTARQGAVTGLERLGGTYGQLGQGQLALASSAWQATMDDILRKYELDIKKWEGVMRAVGSAARMWAG